MHRFFHADRFGKMVEGQLLELDSNNLSHFGAIYWPSLQQKSEPELTGAELRELHLERLRKSIPAFSVHSSRFQSIFATNTIEEAIFFAQTIEPSPEHEVPIYEIFAENFRTFDMNWLDYKSTTEEMQAHYRSYWYAEISNHQPNHGERRHPKLEVQVTLPARVGKLVACALNNQTLAHHSNEPPLSAEFKG